jgi:hypothetical protein
LEAEKGWQEAILFAREMQLHLREKEERLQESHFQIEALKDQLGHLPKVRSFSSGSELSLNSHPSMGGRVTPEVSCASESQQTTAKITLLESELQLYRRQIQKQQQSRREFHQQLHSLVIDLSLSHSTLLASFQTLLSSELFRSSSSSALRKRFQDISRKSIHREEEGSMGSDPDDPNGSPSEQMILSCLSDHIEKTNLLSSWCKPLQDHLMQSASPFHPSPLAPSPTQIPPPTQMPCDDFEMSRSSGSSPPSSSNSSSTSQQDTTKRSERGSDLRIENQREFSPSLEQRIGWEMEQLREQMREMSSRLQTKEVFSSSPLPSPSKVQLRETSPPRFLSSSRARKTLSPDKSPPSKSSQSPKRRATTPPGTGSSKTSSPLKRPASPGSRSQSPSQRSFSPKRRATVSLSNPEPPPRSSSPSTIHRAAASVASTSRLFAPGPSILLFFLIFLHHHLSPLPRGSRTAQSNEGNRIDQRVWKIRGAAHASRVDRLTKRRHSADRQVLDVCQCVVRSHVSKSLLHHAPFLQTTKGTSRQNTSLK